MPRVAEPVQMYLAAGSSALDTIMRGDLSFKGTTATHAGHNTHAFAAKFPPQLPHEFILHLTEPGERVLDPMAGSGTALIEAARLGRSGIGVDLDPLAIRICAAKTTPLDREIAERLAQSIDDDARHTLSRHGDAYADKVLDSLDSVTREFVEYWFLRDTTAELGALAKAIVRRTAPPYRVFFEVLLSSIIVTKSGGVSLARDLAHTRPHKVADKKIKNAVDAFKAKAVRSIRTLADLENFPGGAHALTGDSKRLPLGDETVDLIVTSPPYANAIDYVRAHKFSLVWLGYNIGDLARHRGRYIGAERRPDEDEELKSDTGTATFRKLRERDRARSAIVRRYFLEMTASLGEMHRVLRSGKTAIVVVGPSTIRGLAVDTALILAEIGEQIGFQLVGLKEREIDRNRRLMPISHQSDQQGIEARMHREHVIAFLKPA